MKMQICGYEVIVGDSKKSGRAYDMSRVHTLIPLVPSDKAAGVVGTSYDCPGHIVSKLVGCALPIICEVTMQDVMEYGRRKQQISAISPIDQPRKAA